MSKELVNKSIYDKIIDKGSLDASEILKLGKEKIEIMKDNIISEAKKEANKLIQHNSKQNQGKIKTKTTNLERLTKKEILFKKKELIDKIIDQALIKLKSLNDKQFIELVKKYILAETLTGNEVIKVNKADYGKYLSLFSSDKPKDLVVLDKLNKELGANYNLKLSNSSVNIDGGFIVVSENFDIDLSFNSILNIIKEKQETQIANILYNEEN
ncbi:MAG: V-type ATP synthase subunit E family protein [Bacilli bacterium]|nr:V-type ATP synthase subunit E family protein [Bacilli bacterium]